jgi:hypothetical protein
MAAKVAIRTNREAGAGLRRDRSIGPEAAEAGGDIMGRNPV